MSNAVTKDFTLLKNETEDIFMLIFKLYSLDGINAMEKSIKNHFLLYILYIITNLVILSGLGTQVIAQTWCCSNTVLLSKQINGSLTKATSARKLFQEAYENRYTWSPQFPGYIAVVEYKQGGEYHKGNIRIDSNKNVEVTGIDDKDVQKNIEDTLKMQITHRQSIPFDVAHKDSIFKLGTTDNTGAIEILEYKDKTESRYKIFHKQLIQVNRLLGNAAVTVNVLRAEMTPHGYLATQYQTIFRQSQTKQILGQEESEDTYRNVDEYYILAHQVIRDSQQSQQVTVVFDFSNIKLLSSKNN